MPYYTNSSIHISLIFIFKCKCGENHDTKLDPNLVQKLEQLHKALNCSKIIVHSGYRCSAHDKNVGGNGYGQYTKGTAADIVCYDQSGKKISSKIVSCVAQDIGFGGIVNSVKQMFTACGCSMSLLLLTA